MIFIDPAPVERTIIRLIAQLEAQAPDTGEMQPENYEKIARAINGQIKAVQEIYAYNQKRAAQRQQTEHMNYDELPPPSPEQRAQFIERLTRLYTRLNGTDEIPRTDR